MSKFTAALVGLLFVMLFSIAYYQGQVEKLKHEVAEITQVAKEHQATIDIITARNKLAAELDIKYTKELADAQKTISDLRVAVDSGVKRLRINATCQAGNTAAASSVGNAATPTITADAERDYWRLQTGIETASQQVKYLQEYINNVCLN